MCCLRSGAWRISHGAAPAGGAGPERADADDRDAERRLAVRSLPCAPGAGFRGPRSGSSFRTAMPRRWANSARVSLSSSTASPSPPEGRVRFRSPGSAFTLRAATGGGAPVSTRGGGPPSPDPRPAHAGPRGQRAPGEAIVGDRRARGAACSAGHCVAARQRGGQRGPARPGPAQATRATHAGAPGSGLTVGAAPAAFPSSAMRAGGRPSRLQTVWTGPLKGPKLGAKPRADGRG